MKKNYILIAFILLAQWASANNVTGNLRGRVTAELTAQPIAGASVQINGKTIETDMLGIFEIDALEVGVYSMTVQKINFKTTTQTFSIKANETA